MDIKQNYTKNVEVNSMVLLFVYNINKFYTFGEKIHSAKHDFYQMCNT